MERLVRVPYGLYQGTHYGHTLPLGHPGLSEHQQPEWRQNMGAPTFLARPRLLVPSNTSDYCMDPSKRQQLEAILSQVNSGLSLRLCEASSKEVGVQVSPRVDKSVQCSLGPRTLHSRSPRGSPGPKVPLPGRGGCSPAPGRTGLLRSRKEDKDAKAPPGPVEASWQQSPPMPRSEEDRQEELRPQDPPEKEDAPGSRDGRSQQAQGDAAHRFRKPNFQILEPKYGYFHCKDCKIRWESAYVWCISGTNKVYFKQLCSKCQKSFNPYRVEAIQCQTCSQSRCSCPRKKRHIDLRRPHRQELCGRCKDKRVSCGNIYSFKYVI